MPLADAVGMVSANPARVTRIDKDVGMLKEGLKADIVLMTEDLKVQSTIVCGERVFGKEETDPVPTDVKQKVSHYTSQYNDK